MSPGYWVHESCSRPDALPLRVLRPNRRIMPMSPPPDLSTLSLAEIARLAAEQRLPPVERWNPDHCGDSEMRIAADGTWFHQGTPIGRPEMVRLFATILRREPDGSHVLVTPGREARHHSRRCGVRRGGGEGRWCGRGPGAGLPAQHRRFGYRRRGSSAPVRAARGCPPSLSRTSAVGWRHWSHGRCSTSWPSWPWPGKATPCPACGAAARSFAIAAAA